MSMSDWSSDVCSSDLEGRQGEPQTRYYLAGLNHDVLLGCYFWLRTHSARILASSSVTGFGGIGIGPHTPWLPFLMWPASRSAAPSCPAYLAATSLKAGPTSLASMLWHAAQGLLLNSASPSCASAGCRVSAPPRASIGIRIFFIRSFPQG